jgi:DMSO/TMAO reductase YedYZ molybdopterin-dependent catalytic subunit
MIELNSKRRLSPRIPMGNRPRIGRRAFLGGVAAISFGNVGVETNADGQASEGLILRESEPRNLESPFSSLDGFITATEKFYVRDHFAVPRLEASSWRLSIEGAVDHAFEIGYAELRRMPSRTMTAMLECAGNGRVLLVPKAKGVLWDSGAVGNAEWTGVPLSALLERASVRDKAVEVILEGADKGKTEEEPKSPGEIHFARSVPLGKALGNVLLAYKMNGKELSPDHGYPVRAIVPGWYGMASIKWLSRVIITDRPFAGYYQTLDYSFFEQRNGIPTLVPLTEIAVKAQIARPMRGEAVPRDKDYRVYGAAWAGEAIVSKVEISTDGAKSWSSANLLGNPVRHAWRLWEWNWRTPKKVGRQNLMARATDDRGRTQPLQRDVNLRTVMIHHVVPIEVERSRSHPRTFCTLCSY